MAGMAASGGQDFDSFNWRRRLVAARGTGPADLLLTNCRVVNVFTGELEETDVAIIGNRIAYTGNVGRVWDAIDLQGKIVAPSFIDITRQTVAHGAPERPPRASMRAVAKGKEADMAPNGRKWSKPVAGWGPCDPSGGQC